MKKFYKGVVVVVALIAIMVIGLGVGLNSSAVKADSTIVLHAIKPIQFDTSSEGVTTIDTIGNTYQEPAGQTRLTTIADYKQRVALKVSAYVSNGTGTIELYDVTSGMSLGTRTITAKTETALAMIGATVPTNVSDVITIRVKNSIAGESVTIVKGGMMIADQINNVTATGTIGMVSTLPAYLSSWKYAVLPCFSTASVTIQPVLTATQPLGDSGSAFYNLGVSSSVMSSSIDVSPQYKFYNSSTNGAQLNVTTLAGQVMIGQTYGISIDSP